MRTLSSGTDLDNHSDAHAAADAQRGHTLSSTPRQQRVNQVVRMRAPLAPIGWPSAMAPPRIDLREIQPEFPCDGERLRRERFVELEEIDL
jgi:hypothetical protein